MVTTKSGKVSSEDALPNSLADISEDQEEAVIETGLWRKISEEVRPDISEVIGLDQGSEPVEFWKRENRWPIYHFGELEDVDMPFVSGDASFSENEFAVDEPHKRVFTSHQIQRLLGSNGQPGVNQHGPWGKKGHDYPVDRAEHSVGVVNLLRRYNAPIREQVAGSLHDIGHGPYSHFAEDVLEVIGEDVSYEFHEEMAHERLDEPYTGEEGDPTLNERLLEVGFNGHQILDDYEPDNGQSEFPLLEKDKPDICADRWEYFIRDASFLALNDDSSTVDEWNDLVSYDEHLDVANFLERFQDDENEMINKRVSDQREFVMTDPEVAADAARSFMQMNEEYWWNPVNRAQSRGYAFAAAESVEESGIAYEDFFRMEDAEAYDFIDDRAGELLSDVEEYFTQENIEVVESEEDADFTLGAGYEWEGTVDPETGEGYHKTIDPKIMESGDQDPSEMKRASEYDEELREEIEQDEKWSAQDQHIRVEGFDFNQVEEYL